jgi:hypothetical protein
LKLRNNNERNELYEFEFAFAFAFDEKRKEETRERERVVMLCMVPVNRLGEAERLKFDCLLVSDVVVTATVC